jgi:hypothetical protein
LNDDKIATLAVNCALLFRSLNAINLAGCTAANSCAHTHSRKHIAINVRNKYSRFPRDALCLSSIRGDNRAAGSFDVVCVMTHDDDHARENCALTEDTVSYVTTSISRRMCRPAAPVLQGMDEEPEFGCGGSHAHQGRRGAKGARAILKFIN